MAQMRFLSGNFIATRTDSKRKKKEIYFVNPALKKILKEFDNLKFTKNYDVQKTPVMPNLLEPNLAENTGIAGYA